MTWYNVRTKRQAPARTVSKYHQYGRDRFWRHQAVNLQFRQIGSAWFLQVNPKSFYTHDGETPYNNDKVGALTTTIRAKEHNPQVLNHVLFWSDILSQQQPHIEIVLFGKALMSIEKEPISGIIGAAIPNDSDEYDESDAPQLDFGSILLTQSRDTRGAWDNEVDGDGEDDEEDCDEY